MHGSDMFLALGSPRPPLLHPWFKLVLAICKELASLIDVYRNCLFLGGKPEYLGQLTG